MLLCGRTTTHDLHTHLIAAITLLFSPLEWSYIIQQIASEYLANTYFLEIF